MRPGCLAPRFEELPQETAPWLRCVVGAPEGRKPKAQAKSKRGAHLTNVRTKDACDVPSGSVASSSSAAPVVAERAVDPPVSEQDDDGFNDVMAALLGDLQGHSGEVSASSSTYYPVAAAIPDEPSVFVYED